MNYKRKVILFFILVLSVGVFLYISFKNRRQKPNIVLITIDTLRADTLASYGNINIETPNIDSIAKKGALFSQAITQVPITLPSHSSIFTGLNPNVHNVRRNGTFRLDDSETTLAEILKDNGYTTAAFIGAFPVDSRFGLNQGFDFYDDDLSRDKLHKPKRKKKWQGHLIYYLERRAEDVIKSAIKWLSNNKQQSFFIWIHLYDPHAVYSPPEPFKTIYKGSQGRLYEGEVAYVDYALGELFESLKDWGILKDTLMIITSDHGESLGEHNYFFDHGDFLYEPSLWIPLIISFPPIIPDGKVVDNLVRSIDIMPTVLDILGIKPPENIQGISLIPLVSQTDTEDIKLTSYGETLDPKLRYGGDELRSYRTDKWKYIRYIKDNKIVKEELFDLENDAFELNNLSEIEESKTKELSLILDKVIKDALNEAANRNTGIDMDEETKEKLRSLGYLQ